MAPAKESAKDNKDVLGNLNPKSNKFLERTRKSPKSRWKLLARAIKGNEIVEVKEGKTKVLRIAGKTGCDFFCRRYVHKSWHTEPQGASEREEHLRVSSFFWK